MSLQGVLHWVAEPSPGVDPLKVEVRLFDRLFLSEVSFVYLVKLTFHLSQSVILKLIVAWFCDKNPAELEDWLGDLNPESKVVIQNAYAVPLVRTAALGDRFQFERLGKF